MITSDSISAEDSTFLSRGAVVGIGSLACQYGIKEAQHSNTTKISAVTDQQAAILEPA